MSEREVSEKREELTRAYRLRWGKDVDFTAVSALMSRELLLITLFRIVDTGESMQDGQEYVRRLYAA